MCIRDRYELMPRIWMTDDTRDKFRFLSELEIDLREDLKKYMKMCIRDRNSYGIQEM